MLRVRADYELEIEFLDKGEGPGPGPGAGACCGCGPRGSDCGQVSREFISTEGACCGCGRTMNRPLVINLVKNLQHKIIDRKILLYSFENKILQSIISI